MRELPVVAYLGIPLRTSDGHVLGSFCLIDSEARSWTEDEVQAARELAAATMREIEFRALVATRAAETEQARREARAAAMRELAVGLYHQVNNALASLLAAGQVLENELTGRQLQRLQLMMEQGQRISDVLRRLDRVEELRSVEYVEGLRMVDLSGQDPT